MFKVTQVASCRARNGAPMSDTKIPVNNSLSWAPCPPAAESLGLLTKMKSPNPYSVPPVQVSKVWAPLYYLCLLRVGVILLYSMCVCVCVCVCVCALSHFSHVWLCDSKDCSLPHSSVHGILQTRILEWVAVPSSRGSSRPGVGTCVSFVSCIGRWVLYH